MRYLIGLFVNIVNISAGLRVNQNDNDKMWDSYILIGFSRDTANLSR